MLLRHTITPLASVTVLAAAALALPGSTFAASSGGARADSTTPTASTTTTNASTAPTTGKRPSSVGHVRLQSSSRLRVRKTPTRTASVGSVRKNQRLRISCQMNAGRASGKYGTSRIWDRIKLPNGRTGYVPDASIEDEKSALVAPFCGWPDPKTPVPTAADNPLQGRCSSVATVPLDPAPANRAAFVAAAGPLARQSARSTGVPASVTLAQGILESASGTLTAGANNYFGIKARSVDQDEGIFRWESMAVGCVHKPTYESESGRLVRQIAQFRMYPGMGESFQDHGLFLRENSRYAPAFKYSDDPPRFAKAIQTAGYATDPKYASLLISLITSKTLPLTPYDD